MTLGGAPRPRADEPAWRGPLPGEPLRRGFALAPRGSSADPEPPTGAEAPRRSPVVRLILTFLAMIGWRLEHLTPAWAIGGAMSLLIAHTLMERGDWRVTLPYFLLTLLFYYGGNALLLASRAPEWAVRRFGEQRAWRGYETVLGLMFLNQGLGVGCMTALALPGFNVFSGAPWVRGAGVLLVIVGVTVKLWATWLVGADIFYYKDLFLRRPAGNLVRTGPYRLLSNPMYGVGQLQGYGYALVAASWPGLLGAALGQLLTYAFLFAVERPFVRAAYAVPPRP